MNGNNIWSTVYWLLCFVSRWMLSSYSLWLLQLHKFHIQLPVNTTSYLYTVTYDYSSDLVDITKIQGSTFSDQPFYDQPPPINIFYIVTELCWYSTPPSVISCYSAIVLAKLKLSRMQVWYIHRQPWSNQHDPYHAFTIVTYTRKLSVDTPHYAIMAITIFTNFY